MKNADGTTCNEGSCKCFCHVTGDAQGACCGRDSAPTVSAVTFLPAGSELLELREQVKRQAAVIDGEKALREIIESDFEALRVSHYQLKEAWEDLYCRRCAGTPDVDDERCPRCGAESYS